MEHRDRLRSLADDELLAGLSRIVGRRNQITSEFLAYLAELDQRQLFLDLGYPSLFDYCVKALGLCESTAGRHIAAARVCRSYPQALDQVARGDLHASALSVMKKHLTADGRGPALRAVHAQEHATGRSAPCRAIPEARHCGLNPSLAHTQRRESGRPTSAPDRGGPGKQRPGR